MKINLDFGGVVMSGCLFDTDDMQGSISVAVDMDIVRKNRVRKTGSGLALPHEH